MATGERLQGEASEPTNSASRLPLGSKADEDIVPALGANAMQCLGRYMPLGIGQAP